MGHDTHAWVKSHTCMSIVARICVAEKTPSKMSLVLPKRHFYNTRDIFTKRETYLQNETSEQTSPVLRAEPWWVLMRPNATHCNALQHTATHGNTNAPWRALLGTDRQQLSANSLQCVAVRCSAVQCGAVRCSAVQCGAVRCSVAQCGAVRCSALQCVAECCSALQCIAARCSAM